MGDLLHIQGKPRKCNEKERKAACQTSIDIHPDNGPKGSHRQGRDHQEENNSLYSKRSRLLPPSLRTVREDQKSIHSWMSRICNHQPGWIRWLFWEPKRETNTIEMILLQKAVSKTRFSSGEFFCCWQGK
ncbi:hypothetical protein M440DRAFT_1100584 [Trichoderma longibrachiatum ATCC 18648]|uniref:Uncharacterized protein n=1 Tax=Trichoderma longibrachiatum ATCC 18648 TaxID=983965 RepID=A0A2T4BS90_TRILO|nr:hypothetical protein M440DRAFT_1100584 [Trichoderma longibrachiatum ATCC 18648]